jgi:23S rRNA (uridine2479-2'-O)-methyltransferase
MSARTGARVRARPALLRVSSRNARFQQWQALLTNRGKRNRARQFLVQGVRPITLAVQYNWHIHAVLYRDDQRLSAWAQGILGEAGGVRVAMSPQLMRELGDKTEEIPEILAVVGLPSDALERIPLGSDFLGIVLDRPASPGNIGTLVRSADAFGASGVVITGHAADAYDPKSVRASTGSMFALPVVRASAPRAVLDWLDEYTVDGRRVRVVGTDETGSVPVADYDLTGPTLLVVGNETTGMSSAWRDLCDDVVRIPIGGAASSLNAANAGTVVLYEAVRQRDGAATRAVPAG